MGKLKSSVTFAPVIFIVGSFCICLLQINGSLGALVHISMLPHNYGLCILGWHTAGRVDPTWALLNIGNDGLCICGHWFFGGPMEAQ